MRLVGYLKEMRELVKKNRSQSLTCGQPLMPLPLYEAVRKENEKTYCTVQQAVVFVGKENFISNRQLIGT